MQDVKKIIINAAQTLFSRFGFKKTAMNDIAQAVNKGKSSLYYYFKSKDEVFKAVIEKEYKLLKSALKNAINNKTTAKNKIREYFIIRIKMIGSLKNFYEILRNEYFDQYDYISKIKQKDLTDKLNVIKKILKEAVMKNEFIVKDLDLTSHSIVTALKGYELSLDIYEDNFTIENHVDDLLQIMFNGLISK